MRSEDHSFKTGALGMSLTSIFKTLYDECLQQGEHPSAQLQHGASIRVELVEWIIETAEIRLSFKPTTAYQAIAMLDSVLEDYQR